MRHFELFQAISNGQRDLLLNIYSLYTLDSGGGGVCVCMRGGWVQPEGRILKACTTCQMIKVSRAVFQNSPGFVEAHPVWTLLIRILRDVYNFLSQIACKWCTLL